MFFETAGICSGRNRGGKMNTKLIEAAKVAEKNIALANQEWGLARVGAKEEYRLQIQETLDRSLGNFVERFEKVFPYLAIKESGVDAAGEVCRRPDSDYLYGDVYVVAEVDEGVEATFSSSAWLWKDGVGGSTNTYFHFQKGGCHFTKEFLLYLGHDNDPHIDVRDALEKAKAFFRTREEWEALPLFKKFLRYITKKGGEKK